jgi:hypothetical protein
MTCVGLTYLKLLFRNYLRITEYSCENICGRDSNRTSRYSSDNTLPLHQPACSNNFLTRVEAKNIIVGVFQLGEHRHENRRIQERIISRCKLYADLKTYGGMAIMFRFTLRPFFL